jgi:ubiquinone biosynthesis protein COQ9
MISPLPAPSIAPQIALRDRLLDAMLETAPDRGWTSLAVKEAAKAAGLTPGEAELAAPHGPRDLIDALADRADKAALARLAEADLGALKIRERVTLAVRLRVEAIGPHRKAVQRAAAHMALMTNAPTAGRLAWRSADRIWRALGDPSTDENYYSKRAILAGVLSSVIGMWLLDSGEQGERTWAFLDARIENVMQFERLKARLKPYGFIGLQAIGALAAARYRARPAPPYY